MIPFYLRLRGLNELESALRDLDSHQLRSMANYLVDPNSGMDDPCTERLLIAELARRGMLADSRMSFPSPATAP